jgi:D-3-phosphoglycerate dehydrogenase/C-terminal binding protein
MSTPTIYITDFWTGAPDVEQQAVGGLARVVTLGAHHEKDILPKIGDAAALLVWHDIRLTTATLDALKQCKVIVRIGVGFDNVPIDEAARRGIPVCNVPDYGTEEVADHSIALLLALVRSFPQFAEEIRRPTPFWDARSPKRSPRLRGKVFGVIGLGRIGTATALRAKAFGLDVVAYDPYIADGRDKALGIRMAFTLPELLGQSDFVSLHTPLTAETRGLIDAETLRQFKPGAILINTARGPICDTTAVLKALESGHLAGAGLDVIPVEPPLADDPLLSAYRNPQHIASQRVILTPHSAFYSEEGFEEMRRKAALEAGRALRGERLRNRVN